MTDVLDIAAKILGAVGAVGILTTILGKKLTPRRSPAEQHDSRVAELERARLDDRAQIDRANSAADRAETAAANCRHDLRLLSDHVLDLRAQIVELGGHPIDFPEGLRL